jgi:uncharacterized protein YecT (DUF1311 family)
MALAWLMAASAVTTCIASEGQTTRRPLPAMKGYELYGWRSEDGSPRFSLHVGTNREKTEAEIRAKDCTLGSLEALLGALGRLALGEQVTWVGASRTTAPSAVPERERSSEACLDQALTQGAMNGCGARDADDAKKHLASLLAELVPTLEPGQARELSALQAKWTAARDAECRWEAEFHAGGSVAPMLYAYCIAGKTQDRIRWLKTFLCEGAGMTGHCAASEKYGG